MLHLNLENDFVELFEHRLCHNKKKNIFLNRYLSLLSCNCSFFFKNNASHLGNSRDHLHDTRFDAVIWNGPYAMHRKCGCKCSKCC